MTSEQAGDLVFKGVKLNCATLLTLRWLKKNCIHKQLRDAAAIVINTRIEMGDVEPEPKMRTEYKEKVILTINGKQDFRSGYAEDLKELFKNTPDDLF